MNLAMTCDKNHNPSYTVTPLFWDALSSVVTNIIPSKILWAFRKNIKKVATFPIGNADQKVKQVATLYFHQRKNECSSDVAVLALHGDKSFPETLLPQIDLAQKHTSAAIFSLSIPNTTYKKNYQNSLKQALDKIEQFMKERGGFSGIIAVGHSRGAIEASYAAFVDNDKRINSVISLAGRLRSITYPPFKPCSQEFSSHLDKIDKAIRKHPDIPLYQIFGDRDWNAPREAMAVRPDPRHCYVVKGASHLNVLYNKKAQEVFVRFLIPMNM